MTKPNDFFEGEQNLKNKGKLTCDKKILSSIISLATKEINGVAEMTKTTTSKVGSLLSKHSEPSVRIKFLENGNLAISVYITVKNNFSVPDVAYRVQENIKNQVATMISTPVKKINVYVKDVDFSEEQ